MSQAAVEKTLGKLLTDEGFRRRFLKDPAGVSFAAGLELSQAELDALSRLPGNAIARFSGCLDARICRIPLDEEARPPREGISQARRRHTEERAGQGCCSAHRTNEDER